MMKWKSLTKLNEIKNNIYVLPTLPGVLRKLEMSINKIWIGHTFLTQYQLIKREPPPLYILAEVYN